MNSSPTKRVLFITIAAMLTAVSVVKAKDPVDYVNPNIGGIAHFLVAGKSCPIRKLNSATVSGSAFAKISLSWRPIGNVWRFDPRHPPHF
jgi:hypothetical protein